MINITPKPLDIDLQVGSDHSETISTRLLFTIGDFELNFETSEDAKENIEKKYGEQVADAVFNKNALEIIKG